MKEDVLGQFEQLVLTAVLSLRENAYGPKIHENTAGRGHCTWHLRIVKISGLCSVQGGESDIAAAM
jgi:hypothetical protein